MVDAALLAELAAVVGGANVLTGAYDLDRYTGDALAPSRAFGAEHAFERLAEAVVRPAGADEVSAVLRLAQRRRVPVVPYGGGTGVMGGAVPVCGGIVLDLQRMNRLIRIDPASLTAEVEAGILLGDLEAALAEQGLMPGHDPYSVPIATVGGAISTNGVGYRAAAHGPMGEQVVALEAALPDGRRIATRAVPKYSAGPNLNHLFIGAEGVFGVITRAILKIYRQPEARRFESVSFNSFDAGFAAAAELLALGVRPALLDLTEEDDGILLHLLFEGFAEGVAAGAERALRECVNAGGRPLGPAPTADYWDRRRDSALNYRAAALGQPRSVRWSRWGRRRGFDYLHLALPAGLVLEYRRQADALLAAAGIRVVEYAIWSRPELFSMLVVPETGEGEEARRRLAGAVDQVLQLAQDLGGAMEYCHGVGVKLNHLLPREQGPAYEVTRQLKQLLDPHNILNPGKLGLPAEPYG